MVCLWRGATRESKHEAFTQCCFNVGPPSSTLAQHWNSIGLIPCVCWLVNTGLAWCWSGASDHSGFVTSVTMQWHSPDFSIGRHINYANNQWILPINRTISSREFIVVFREQTMKPVSLSVAAHSFYINVLHVIRHIVLQAVALNLLKRHLFENSTYKCKAEKHTTNARVSLHTHKRFIDYKEKEHTNKNVKVTNRKLPEKSYRIWQLIC